MAMSALASQLQSLSTEHRNSAYTLKASTRPSILFDPREAADIDLQTIFALAQSGLEELTSMDGRFEAYKRTLFGLESRQMDRELQGQEFNAKLDASVGSYLRLLSGFLLLTPAHQTLEYLIRRYKIHVYNVDDVMKNILPYHETSLFVRLVQLLHIEKNKWSFLATVKISGAPPPRIVLVQQCLQDMAILETICESAMAVSNRIAMSGTTISFSVAIIIEALGAAGTVSSSIVNKILPFILRSFDRHVAEEFRVGGLMIIGTLASKTSLSQSILERLFNSMAKSSFLEMQEVEADRLLQMSMMVMVQLVQTQALDHFPEKAFRFLVKVRDFPGALADLTKSFNTEKFISLFLKVLVEHCLVNSHYEQALLRLMDTLPLRNHVKTIVSQLLTSSLGRHTPASTDSQSSSLEELKTREMAKSLLMEIGKRFPGELDEAINKCIQQSQSDTKSVDRISTIKFLSDVLQGSLHAPMAESDGSVYFSLENSQPKIRKAALQHISNIASLAISTNNAEANMLLREAVLRRLHDDDLHVVRCALCMEGLARIVSPDALFKAQVSILSRCEEILRTGSRPLKAEAKALAKRCLQFLACDFLDQNPGHIQHVGCIILSCLLLYLKTWKMNWAALTLAKGLHWHLFRRLSDIEDEKSMFDDKSVKESRKILQPRVNRNIVNSLANALLEEFSTNFLLLTQCTASYARAKPLILISLTQCLRFAPQEKMWEVIEKCLSYFRQEWSDVESEDSFSTSKFQHIDFDAFNEEVLFSIEFHQELDSKPRIAYTKLLMLGFYRLLKIIAGSNTVEGQELKGSSMGILEDLFVIFSMSHSRELFKEHIQLILKCVSTSVVPFLSKFFTAEGSAVPTSVQIESLRVLAAELASGMVRASGVKCIQLSNLQIALPWLLVALASPLKAVRAGASECIQKLLDLWRENAISLSKNGAQPLQLPLLPPDIFRTFMELLTEFRSAFSADGNFLTQFLISALSPTGTHNKCDVVLDVEGRLNNASQKSVMLFLLQQALQLPTYAQCVLIVALQQTGHAAEQASRTQALLFSLLNRRKQFHLTIQDTHSEKLSGLEIQLLNSLLQTNMQHVENFKTVTGATDGGNLGLDILFLALNIKGGSLEDPAVVNPCKTAVESLGPKIYDALDMETQDKVFGALIALSINKAEDVRSATLLTLKKLNVNVMTVVRHIEKISAQEPGLKQHSGSPGNTLPEPENLMIFTATVLNYLVWKSDVKDRELLVEPLFRLVKKLSSLECSNEMADRRIMEAAGNALSENIQQLESSNISYLQLLALTVLENILNSITSESEQETDTTKASYDVDFLVHFIHVTADVSTRNQALLLLTILAKQYPDRILNHVIGVFSILGQTTIIQDDTHSHLVTQQLISAVVPGWLAKTNAPQKLLQIFVQALPQIPAHRRIPLLKNTLRVMGENTSLHVLLLLLLKATLRGGNQGVSLRKKARNIKVETDEGPEFGEWSVEFSGQLCKQYTTPVRLHALVKLLDTVRSELLHTKEKDVSEHGENSENLWLLQRKATEFVSNQMQRSELYSEVEMAENVTAIQDAFVGLMEQALLELQILGDKSLHAINPFSKIKKGLHASASSLLDSLINLMAIASFAKATTQLLKSPDTAIRIKVLQLITLKLNGSKDSIKFPRGKKTFWNVKDRDQTISQENMEAYGETVKEIVEVLARSGETGTSSIKLALVSNLDISSQKLAEKLPDVFISSLKVLVSNLQGSRALSIAALHCLAAIISHLSPLLLPVFIKAITELLRTEKKSLSSSQGNRQLHELHSECFDRGSELLYAILATLEVIVEKLGSFLNPYLPEILDLLVLQPQLNSDADSSLSKKTEVVRALLPEKIPARFLLDPLLRTYEFATQIGEASVSACFHTLAMLVTKLDRASVALDNAKNYELCLTTFDLRRNPLKSFKTITVVEMCVISVFTGLVLKLSEASFKPLFVRILEWAEFEISNEEDLATRWNIYRNIVFYRLVNQLAEKLRSVFVPYFQYLLNSCVKHLMKGQERDAARHKKRKKMTSKKTQLKEKEGSPTTKASATQKRARHSNGKSKILKESQILLCGEISCHYR